MTVGNNMMQIYSNLNKMDPCTMQTLPDTLIRQITLYFHPIEYSVECGGDKKMTKVYNPIFLVNKTPLYIL